MLLVFSAVGRYARARMLSPPAQPSGFIAPAALQRMGDAQGATLFTIASNTGWTFIGELEITLKTSEVAVWYSSVSASK